jgi:hypothetical protein
MTSRPHTWITGPDPLRHEQYTAWSRTRAQAHHRGETWNLSFDHWVEIWGSNWSRRGRHRDNLVLMKRVWNQPWSHTNCELVDRVTFHTRQAKIKQERRILRSKDDGSKV